MLEIPEATTLARQARPLVGREVVSAEAGHTPHGFAFYTGDPAAYGPLLAGRRIDDVQAHAGILEFALGERRLTFHDGPRLRLLPPGHKRPAAHQFLAELDDGSALVCTVQMYAGIALLADGEGDTHPYYRAAREAISPLTGAFTVDHLRSIAAAAKPSLSAKGLLATEQRIPGLGNGCVQDILFAAGIPPRRRVATLDDDALTTLHAAVTGVLRTMTDEGGRDTEKDLHGDPGGYATVLSAKTWLSPCPGCGGPITRETFLGGRVYFCPACQPPA